MKILPESGSALVDHCRAVPVVNHVLAKFTGDDSVKIKEVIQSLLPAVECIVKEDVDKAMNKFNPKKVKKQKSPKQEVAMDQAQSETQEGTGEKV